MTAQAVKTVWALHRATRPSYWSGERLRQHQWAKLQPLVRHAYSEVPIYRRLWDRHGFHPRVLRSIDDLRLIPPLEKAELANATPADVLARGVSASTCRTDSTSGSTGRPLRMYLNAADRSWNRVTAWRILFEHGFRWTDRTLEIRFTAGTANPIQRLGIAPKLWVSILDHPAHWVDQWRRFRPDVVVAGASTLGALAKAMHRPPERPPKLIVSDSETLYPETRRLIATRLGADPVDVFGLVELSNFAWQCERRAGFHVSADSHIVEIEGDCGPMIVTGLGLTGMPVIRYRTGDYAQWSAELCPCGRTLPVLSRIFGRAVDSVRLPSGRMLFWPFFHELLARVDWLREWRVRQLTDGSLEVGLVGGEGCVEAVERMLRSRLPEPVSLLCGRVDSLPFEPGIKKRMVTSEIAV